MRERKRKIHVIYNICKSNDIPYMMDTLHEHGGAKKTITPVSMFMAHARLPWDRVRKGIINVGNN
jgi:hypothetical protein